ncbi:HAD family hydrolase [Thermosipho ferrireducens]|uniref:HAD family hydrolase n=1 Tax=Thermosipho ferrireducens TaxID=2571116 RepID=A0ABX7S5F6_9BACT|nr:HAD family hydrolase [Thermosipho ferrireducens]QTA37766.1 HAD family hydrolase [Thermosipho ferrireducens]
MYIFVDYDGTLVKTPEEDFTKLYFYELSKKSGISPEHIATLVMGTIKEMAQNQDGQKTLYEDFVERLIKKDTRGRKYWIELFEDFYNNEFLKIKKFIQPNHELIDSIKQTTRQIIFASNPLFPKIAVEKRIGFVGLTPQNFVYIAYMENSHYFKPNPKFFDEILKKLNLNPSECIMIGDSEADMASEKVGIKFIHVSNVEEWKKYF